MNVEILGDLVLRCPLRRPWIEHGLADRGQFVVGAPERGEFGGRAPSPRVRACQPASVDSPITTPSSPDCRVVPAHAGLFPNSGGASSAGTASPRMPAVPIVRHRSRLVIPGVRL